MIKLIFCLKRKPELSLEEFQSYWRNTHAPLVKQHAETLGIRRYVQCHSLGSEADTPLRVSRAGSLDAAPEIYDGVAELWFDSLEHLAAQASDPDAVAAGKILLEDEAKFIDLENSPLWFAEEHEII